MRAGTPPAQLGEQLRFEIGRDRMLQALSFIVHLPPLHTEKFSQHAFNQVMTQRELPGDLASCCRQSDLAIALHAHQFILLQPAQKGENIPGSALEMPIHISIERG